MVKNSNSIQVYHSCSTYGLSFINDVLSILKFYKSRNKFCSNILKEVSNDKEQNTCKVCTEKRYQNTSMSRYLTNNSFSTTPFAS